MSDRYYKTYSERLCDKIERQNKQIEQMREALRELESNHGGLSDHNYNIVKTAIEAAERGGE